MAQKIETRGVRPRPDQIAALQKLMELDLELTWSMAIRKGLDLFIAEARERLKQDGR